MPVMPWIVNSVRVIFGRFCITMNGASMPCPITILPCSRMLFTALSLSMPPRAWTFLAMISSTLGSALAIEANKLRAAIPVRNLRNIRTSCRMVAIVATAGGMGVA